MSAAALREIRKGMGYDMRSMAVAMELPYRTYQDYEYGRRGIPAAVADKARDVEKRDRKLTARLLLQAQRDIARLYPNGIPSEIDSEEEE